MDTKLRAIVLIDDDLSTNLYHEIILKKAGVAEKIMKFEYAKDALLYLTTKENGAYPQPEIIFLDINMPQMNGWKFLEEYKKLDEKQTAKIVITMLTSSLNQDDKDRALAIKEVSEYISKPLKREMLIDIIEKYFVTENACCQ